MSQKQFVLNYLQNHGPITPLRAQAEAGIWRLASIVYRLRNEGHRIITVPRRTFTGKPYAEYRLIS